MEKVFGLEIPENLEEACELNRTALVIYFMGDAFFSTVQDICQILHMHKVSE
jgi:biuret amidohydrolase